MTPKELLDRFENFVRWWIARPKSFAVTKFRTLSALILACFGAPWFLYLIGAIDRNLLSSLFDDTEAIWGCAIVFSFALVVNCILAYRRISMKRRLIELIGTVEQSAEDRKIMLEILKHKTL